MAVQDDLAAYFGHLQQAFEHSSTGVILERSELYSSDSSGHRIRTWQHGFGAGELELAEDGSLGSAHLAIDARPDKASGDRTMVAAAPNEGALQRYARIGRRLEAIPKHYRDVLEKFYGDEGARWGRERVGPIFAVYQLVPAGKELLTLAGENPHGLAQSDRLFSLWNALDLKTRPRLRQLFRNADSQSRDDLREGVRAYRATRKPEVPCTR